MTAIQIIGIVVVALIGLYALYGLYDIGRFDKKRETAIRNKRPIIKSLKAMNKKLTHHLMRAALGLFVMMLTANLGWAQSTLSGAGTQSNPYLIQSDADWGIFVDWINNHNST